MAKNPWKSWHEVVALRDDLKSGELPLHMFAADLMRSSCKAGSVLFMKIRQTSSP
jgi:hypothetical protein